VRDLRACGTRQNPKRETRMILSSSLPVRILIENLAYERVNNFRLADMKKDNNNNNNNNKRDV
jgi:hypothetical protein